MTPKHLIESRIQKLLCQELDRRIKEASERLPHRCTYNLRHPLDTRRQVDGEANDTYNRIGNVRGLPIAQTIGLCGYGVENPEEWGGTICEDPIDAQRCPIFLPLVTKQALWEGLLKDFQEPAWIEVNLPEVFGLMYAIGNLGAVLPWWKRLWFKLLRIKVEPQMVRDSSLLLPPAPEE